MTDNASGQVPHEREWRDEVAGDDGDLRRWDEDLDALLDDMKDMARTVVECTIEPLRSFAETLPNTLAFESRQWEAAMRGMSNRNRAWRYARRRWHL